MVQIGFIGLKPREMHVFADVQLGGNFLEFAADLSVADQTEMQARPSAQKQVHGSQQSLMILHRRQPGDATDNEGISRNAELAAKVCFRCRWERLERRIANKV